MKWLCTVLLSVLVIPVARAQRVTAELLPPQAAVGGKVNFVIQTEGKTQGRMLDMPEVDGLRVVGKSDQYQMQMSFPGGMTVTTQTTLTLVAERPGTFVIPGLRVRLDGKEFQTPACELRIVDAPSGIPVRPAIPVPQTGAPPPPPAPAPDQGVAQAYGELVMAKRTAYVGEVVPVELRFYVDARIPAQFSEKPGFGGDGFTVQRTGRPTEATRTAGDANYASVSYPTAISAAKSGTLEIPPATLAARVQVPVARPPGMDDFFGGFFGNLGLSETRDIEIRTDAATLEVKPLPADGRPADFSGAIGDFKLQVKASPEKAAAGEPVTLRVTVSGRGNFDAMGPPQLVDAEGWRVYDPVEEFQPSATDPIGFNGEKTFEISMVARDDQRATPPVRFSFFDASQGKYVTLEGAPVAVDARGTGAPAAQTAGAAALQTPAQPTPAAPVAAGELSRDFAPSGFQPAAWGTGFVASGVVLGLLWLAGCAAVVLHRRAASPQAARSAERRARHAKLRQLASRGMPDDDFLDMASRFAEARLGPQVPEDLAVDIEARRALDELFALRGQARFSSRRSAEVRPEDRARFLAALRELDKSMP